MHEFAHGLQERVAATRRSLAAAQEDGDDYGVEVHGAELADLARLAREHGVNVDADIAADVTPALIDLTTVDPAEKVAPAAC